MEEGVGFAQVVFWRGILTYFTLDSCILSFIHSYTWRVRKFWHVRGELGGEEKICLLLLEPWSVRRFDCWLVRGELWNPWRALEFHLAVGQL